jgi:hypothetical protein
MIATIPTLAAVGSSTALVWLWSRWRRAARAEFIRSYVFPKGLFDKLQRKRPELTLKDCQLVAHALRQFFLAYLKGGRRFVSMPSQVTDDLWHELILYTRNYETFCRRAFGGFLHHSPAVVLGSQQLSNEGLRRCWWHACIEENINPRRPTRLPLLFAIDAKLKIADGFRYSVDCRASDKTTRSDGVVIYCGSDFGSLDIDGSVEGFGSDSISDSIGDSVGCGGDGCGGGGCGGD